jgi:hypothetical protein
MPAPPHSHHAAPESLQPQFGAHGTQNGLDSAEIWHEALGDMGPLRLSLAAEGNPAEVVALRWTSANLERPARTRPLVE